jgi:hypothetical protein
MERLNGEDKEGLINFFNTITEQACLSQEISLFCVFFSVGLVQSLLKDKNLPIHQNDTIFHHHLCLSTNKMVFFYCFVLCLLLLIRIYLMVACSFSKNLSVVVYVLPSVFLAFLNEPYVFFQLFLDYVFCRVLAIDTFFLLVSLLAKFNIISSLPINPRRPRYANRSYSWPYMI